MHKGFHHFRPVNVPGRVLTNYQNLPFPRGVYKQCGCFDAATWGVSVSPPPYFSPRWSPWPRTQRRTLPRSGSWFMGTTCAATSPSLKRARIIIAHYASPRVSKVFKLTTFALSIEQLTIRHFRDFLGAVPPPAWQTPHSMKMFLIHSN